MTYTLDPPANGEDWRAFHDIRDAVLFAGKGKMGYDRNHPDDFVEHNHPLLLKADGRPVGTVRLDDFRNGAGCVRLVAIVAEEQGRGHGRVISDLWDARARALRMHTLYVNAAPEALGFYEKLGWQRYEWDRAELEGIAEDCVQMRKLL